MPFDDFLVKEKCYKMHRFENDGTERCEKEQYDDNNIVMQEEDPSLIFNFIRQASIAEA